MKRQLCFTMPKSTSFKKYRAAFHVGKTHPLSKKYAKIFVTF